jgi:hypothetical protein
MRQIFVFPLLCNSLKFGSFKAVVFKKLCISKNNLITAKPEKVLLYRIQNRKRVENFKHP